MGSKIFDALESCFNIFGIAIGVNDIESWLGVTLLVINILAILKRYMIISGTVRLMMPIKK